MKKEDIKGLEFSIRKEEWSRYELVDGTILVARYVLGRLIKEKRADGHGLIPLGQTMFQVRHSPFKERTQPKEKDDPIGEEDKRVFVDFDQITEPWNKYEILDEGKTFLLKTKLVVIDIHKFENKFDKFGYPRYNINHSLNISIREL